ncbi:HU family DNA-binding protein [Flavobacterium capsici]|uniref:HU family DNA-binding protein n=1 Tax=Flavobacterium capsici TaxID=3075618 RepID=A0AA96F4C8_9FLAO|nr:MULTISPECIES: HU family DNA-binding protein [unclassified Flavobacterium]WNM18787.1 HU family DNA-binding protein [Flavobacterium sp. PMR2A8]WNM22838.1 HU family DNA-binding protein [Flavobacterium sp. PMTSA4]
MAIKFQVLPRKNPQDFNAPEKFYAAALGDGETDLDTLAEMIAYQCTVTKPDCYAVLMALEHNIVSELRQGRIVKLGSIGNFQVGISSLGMEFPQEVSANVITSNRIIFRPGKQLRELLKSITYRKAG